MAKDGRGSGKTQAPAGRRSFHGRRHGRRLRPGLTALLDEALPALSLALPPPPARLDPRAAFRPELDPSEIWLEIGFGGGEHLAWQAEHHPDVGVIGAEYFVNGIAKLLRRIQAARLKNVRIFQGDGCELLEALPAAAIDRVFILFPDPWPKARHHKRRLIGRETLDHLARVMKDGVELRLATDDMDYVRWMLERLLVHPAFQWPARGPGEWRHRPADWPPTRYEEKARQGGARPVYLRFIRRPRGAESSRGPGENALRAATHRS